MKIRIILLFACWYSLISCEKRNNEFIDTLKTISKESSISAKFIIIGYQSCISCVDEAELYMIRKLNDPKDNTKFILTAYDSFKELKIKFRDHINNPRLIMDVSNKFYPHLAELNYPLYLEIESNEIINRIVLDTNNSPFIAL